MAFPDAITGSPQWNPRSPAPPRAGLLHVVLVLNRTKLNLLLPFFGLSASAIFAQRFVRGRRGKEEASDGGKLFRGFFVFTFFTPLTHLEPPDLPAPGLHLISVR